MDRREFVRAGLGALMGGTVLGCGSGGSPSQPVEIPVPRLSARVGPPDLVADPGVTPLGLGEVRDGFLSVPAAYDPDESWPLLVALHGAGGRADNWRGFAARADELGIAMLVPDSRGGTWDVIRGGFGPDVDFLDRALTHAFRRVRVDPSRLGLAGFSDGASYALSLGLPNGDLFSHLLAFSPGFLVTTEERGSPRVFVSHGTGDPVLSFSSTEGQIVPLLQQGGYDVTFHQFEGGHELPDQVAEAAMEWFAR